LENNNLQDVSFKIDNEYKLNSSNQVEFGVNLTHNDIKYTYSQNDTSTVIDRSTKGNILTGYVQDRIKIFNNKLTLVPGIRATNYSVTSKNYFEPRMSAVLKVSNPFTIKAAVGRYYQSLPLVLCKAFLKGAEDPRTAQWSLTWQWSLVVRMAAKRHYSENEGDEFWGPRR
jgi:outer membrane receptor for ferrienterochelin and colicin